MTGNTDRAIMRALQIRSNDLPPFRARRAKRDVLPVLFSRFGFTRGVEVGTRIGSFAEMLCRGIPGLQLTCVDPWTKYGNETQEQQDSHYARAVARLTQYGVNIVREFSVEAAKSVPDGSLDFVYIDANHDFDHVMADILAWAPKVRRGGIISGHDYYHFTRSGIVPAVDAYILAHGIRNLFLTNEQESSWLFVKLEE